MPIGWRLGPSAILLSIVLPLELGAQQITGRIVGSDTGDGVALALVEVFDEADDQLGATFSGGDGRFRIDLPSAGGPFRLAISALSHQGVTVSVPRVLSDETVALADIALDPAPIPLQGLVVESRRSRITLGQEAIRRHQLLGEGTFLAGAMIEAAKPNSLTQYIAAATGLFVDFRDGPAGVLKNLQASTGYECVIVMVNRWPLNIPGLEAGDPPLGFPTLDDIPVAWIGGVEIFNDYNEVPNLYLPDAILDQGFITPPEYCGFVNVWLWNSWR
jgi:hypothetical protein